MLHWARILNLFTATMSTMLVLVLTNARASFGRPWESTTQARDFERELIARKAYNELQSRLPVAR